MTDSTFSNESELCTPPEIVEAARNATNFLIPSKSKKLYDVAYSSFKKWKIEKNIPAFSFNENTLLAYFDYLSSQNLQSSTLWTKYSVLKLMINLDQNIDISKYEYNKLKSFLKRKSENHTPKKARIFSNEDINLFLSKAPDEHYLVHKVNIKTLPNFFE